MRKFYIGMPVFVVWSFIFLIALFGFFWECLDVGYFVFLSFVSSILFPGSIEIVLFIIMMSYITIDDEKIVKKIGKK